jgi:hypothetical protein
LIATLRPQSSHKVKLILVATTRLDKKRGFETGLYSRRRDFSGP